MSRIQEIDQEIRALFEERRKIRSAGEGSKRLHPDFFCSKSAVAEAGKENQSYENSKAFIGREKEVGISIYNNMVENEDISFMEPVRDNNGEINGSYPKRPFVDNIINASRCFFESGIWNSVSKVFKKLVPYFFKSCLALFILCIALTNTIAAGDLLLDGKKEAVRKAIEEPEKALSTDNKAYSESKNQRDIGTLRERREEVFKERSGLKNHSKSSGFWADLKLCIGIPLFGLLFGIAVTLFILPIKILFGE